MAAPRLSTQRPDPTRLWVRYSLRPWPGPTGFWTDLAAAGVGQEERADSLESPAVEELDDVFYVPPVSAEPDNDVIEPVWASHVKHVHETYPAWSDPIKTHVEDSEDPQRVARKSAYDRYGGFAIGIALGLFVAIALDFIGLISL